MAGGNGAAEILLQNSQKRKELFDMKNKEIRVLMVQNGVKQWAVAEALGLHEASFSRMMRRELPADRVEQIKAAIQRLAGDRHE